MEGTTTKNANTIIASTSVEVRNCGPSGGTLVVAPLPNAPTLLLGGVSNSTLENAPYGTQIHINIGNLFSADTNLVVLATVPLVVIGLVAVASRYQAVVAVAVGAAVFFAGRYSRGRDVSRAKSESC